jgi:hypothetical protein
VYVGALLLVCVVWYFDLSGLACIIVSMAA